MNTKAISRTIIAIILVVIIGASAAAGGILYYTSTQNKPTLTVAIWGGSWQEYAMLALDGFEEAYNCKLEYYVQLDSDATVAKMISEGSNSPTIDVAMVGIQQAMIAMDSGVAGVLDPTIVTNMADIYDSAKITQNGLTYFVGNAFNCYGIIYNNQKVNSADVTSWKWLWSEGLTDKVGVFPVDVGGGGILLLTSEIWYGDQYHNELNESWAKLQELAPNIGMTYSSGDIDKALAEGTLYAIAAMPLEAKLLKDEGYPVSIYIPENESNLFYADGIIANKYSNADHDLVMALVNWIISPEKVKAYCEATVSSSTNMKATISDSLTEYLLPASIAETQASGDPEYYARNIDSWLETWDSTIVPLLK